MGEKYSALKIAESCIIYPYLYTKDEIVAMYTNLGNDKRVEAEKKNKILDKLRKVYKNK